MHRVAGHLFPHCDLSLAGCAYPKVGYGAFPATVTQHKRPRQVLARSPYESFGLGQPGRWGVVGDWLTVVGMDASVVLAGAQKCIVPGHFSCRSMGSQNGKPYHRES